MEQGQPIVLLLDDDELWLRSLSRALKVRGAKVLTYTTPAQALAALDDGLRPRVCVIDFVLGFGWDGTRFAGAMRERYTKLPPLVLLSGTLEQVGLDKRDEFELALSKAVPMTEVVDQIIELCFSQETTQSYSRLRPSTVEEVNGVRRKRKPKQTPR